MLELRGVTYRVEGRLLLSEVDLSLQQGEWVGVSGASGAGKTTLLRLAADLISPQQGEVRFAGKPLDRYAPTTYRRTVAFLSQEAPFYPGTVEANLKKVFEWRRLPFPQKKVYEAMESLLLPPSLLAQETDRLSAGERRRVHFLRLWLTDPSLFLLDEPDANLDRGNLRRLLGVLANLRREGKGGVIVAHHRQTLSFCDRVFTLHKGSLTATPAP